MTTRFDLPAIRRRLAELRDAQQPGTDISRAAAAVLSCIHDVERLIDAYTAADDARAAAERDADQLRESLRFARQRITAALTIIDRAVEHPARLANLPYDLTLVLESSRDTAAAA